MKALYNNGEVKVLPAEEETHVIRHTAAHIMAQAIQRLHPQAKFAYGPATERGFYYDVDLNGETHEGEMIVNYHIAEDVLDILRQLYEANYPIERIRLVDEYDADDERSMEDNNSSAFNFRLVSHTNRVSRHGLGLAVDINTLYNPYLKVVDGERIVEPVTGEPYVDRSAAFPYKIVRDDLCCSLFLAHGFEWGGDWESRKDYQHFEVPDERIRQWYPQYS